MGTKKKRDREERTSLHSPNNKADSIGINSRASTDTRSVARGSKRNNREGQGNSKTYLAAGLGVVGLLLCAFYLPQFLFQVRDNALYSDTVVSERESVDVLIGDSYDLSLYNRMYNFAEGLARGVSYYVSEQDMEVDEELYDRLNGLELDTIAVLMDFHLITPAFTEYFMIRQRKQYVIYSDDYAQGVNFIIWYLELEGPSGERLELLVDAETSAIYGIKAEKNSLMTQEEINSWQYYLYAGSLVSHLQNSGLNTINQLWFYLAMEFDVISMSELQTVYAYWENYLFDFDFESEERLRQMTVLSEGEWLDENNLVFNFPYGEYLVTLKLQMTQETLQPTCRYHDVFYGIESICRMIPEFMEEN